MRARAGVGALVLTHISDELDEEWATREAERTFGGPGAGRARGRRLHGLTRYSAGAQTARTVRSRMLTSSHGVQCST